ncbi:MAG: hypothetical protein U0935_05895 [Pirellulales bacterium]
MNLLILAACDLSFQLYRVESRRWPLVEPDAWLVIVVVMSALGILYHLT